MISHSGQELFYKSGGQLMVLDVIGGPGLTDGNARLTNWLDDVKRKVGR